ncbi:hypothetical protein AVEN_219740-1 [Araneus ventricosus]|uniref:Mutator-like transposase domain-containing protein n=1 Tax=Araneus ventricosus TaxID=182803 RepID=A0A4Y2X7P7_ARAVE|nr:hypothetical protein AVEN_219740-1 [Araneus ventricosus]
MILGIPAMDSRTFSNFLSDLVIKNKDFKKQVLDLSRDVVRGKYIDCDSSLENQEVIDVCVSYDGTWQNRGHTSLHGIGIVIDILTGLVIDFEVLSKFCQDCVNSEGMLGKNTPEFRIWHDSHKNDCQKNFNGSSNSMEMNSAAILWKRSVKEAKMRYMTLLSDGDGKTHQHLNEIQVYGKNVTIMKEECINHVAKRVGTCLRNVVQDWKKKGVTLGGKKRGSLKDETIKKLQNFYRKAITDNAPDIDKMKSYIFATFHHCMSTDKNPHHSKCPVGKKILVLLPKGFS